MGRLALSPGCRCRALLLSLDGDVQAALAALMTLDGESSGSAGQRRDVPPTATHCWAPEIDTKPSGRFASPSVDALANALGFHLAQLCAPHEASTRVIAHRLSYALVLRTSPVRQR